LGSKRRKGRKPNLRPTNPAPWRCSGARGWNWGRQTGFL